MTFPEFPKSRAISLDDKRFFDRAFAVHSPELSAYNFTNLYAWGSTGNWQVSTILQAMIVHYQHEGITRCFEPIGAANPKDFIDEAYERMDASTLDFKRLHKATATEIERDKRYILTPDRDNADYLYATADLINLPGRKYSSKRNFINRIKSEREYEYLEITRANVMECHEFAEKWCEDKTCESDEGLQREKCAVYHMLTNYERLDVFGGAIKMDGKIVAFTLGEAINTTTMVVHVEKADASIPGIYQLMNNEFCSHEAFGFEYVNREQDIGIPGLRKAKESYKPIRLIETFNVQRK